MPTQAQLNNLANNYGLNCVHVYLESYWVSVGANASIADTLVNECANAGLYVIITIGGADKNGSFNSSEATAFWNFYAPRYKDRTHVIYEGYNEPAWYGPDNRTTSDWNNQVAMYKNIRSLAPNTHILLFSFMGGLGTSSALVNGLNYVQNQGVNFANASIAFHGYTDYNSLQNGITTAQYDSFPLALTCTEWSASDSSYLTIFENHQVNWMYFTWLTANDSDLNTVSSAAYNDGVYWTFDALIGAGVGNGTYKIISRNSGKAMDAYGAQTANGTQIIQWTYGSGSNQKWTLTNLGNNVYKIIGVQSGKSIDIYGWGTANGTKVELWDYYGGNNQQFGLSATDSGYYRMTPQNATGSCLDVEGVSTADGAVVHLWTVAGGNNQQWAFQSP